MVFKFCTDYSEEMQVVIAYYILVIHFSYMYFKIITYTSLVLDFYTLVSWFSHDFSTSSEQKSISQHFALPSNVCHLVVKPTPAGIKVKRWSWWKPQLLLSQESNAWWIWEFLVSFHKIAKNVNFRLKLLEMKLRGKKAMNSK